MLEMILWVSFINWDVKIISGSTFSTDFIQYLNVINFVNNFKRFFPNDSHKI